jgi:hypothetical protein
VNGSYASVVIAPSWVVTAFNSICSKHAVEALETFAQTDSLEQLPFLQSSDWQDFSSVVRATFANTDQVLIRGLPVSDNGATLLLAARTIVSRFRTYRGDKIIKRFKMSPWTTELSHTTREGEFHTDLNTESRPPAVTAMQCLEPDPGSPDYGVSRVARLNDLLTFLSESKDEEALNFLTKESVTMLNDYSSSSWSGRMVEGNMIRYHPETLRAAARREEHLEALLEHKIAAISKALFAVSQSLIMERGDVLLLSNHRTLHYRGECSVVFETYPTEFLSRSVFILHGAEELKY